MLQNPYIIYAKQYLAHFSKISTPPINNGGSNYAPPNLCISTFSLDLLSPIRCIISEANN